MRKATPAATVASVRETPQASVWTEVDVTQAMDYLRRLRSAITFEGVKVSPLLVVSSSRWQSCARSAGLRPRKPHGDEPNGAFIRIHRDVNLETAVATPRGLIAPDIKKAQDLSARELAPAITQRAMTAREGKTSVSDQRGGTITYQQVMAVFTEAGRPLRARQVCEAMDVAVAPNNINNVRLKLKRLAGRGILAEAEPGLFTRPRP
nr:2-oxo acid dehydrogenase subunit E2 [Streptomyces chrestomyceticus]